MVLHIIFIIIYLALGNIFDAGAIAIDAALVVHCVLGILVEFNKAKNFITPIFILYIAVIIASIGNAEVQLKMASIDFRLGRYLVTRHIDEAVNIMAIGSAFMFIGFQMFSKKQYLPSIKYEISHDTANKLFYYVLFLAVFNELILTLLYSLGSIARVVQVLGIIGILFYSRLGAAENSRRFLTYGVILGIVQTINSLYHSFLRAELILPSVIFFVGYFVGKGHIKFVFSYRVIPAVLLFGIFFTIFGILGKNRARGEKGNVTFINIIEKKYFDDKEEAVDVFAEKEENQGVLERSSNLVQLTNAINLTKLHGFYDGAVSAPLLVALIPRVFWPDKPQIVIGQWFAGSIGMGEDLGGGRSSNSINITIPGEGYVDFGWFGVILLCTLYGCILSLFWNAVEFYSGATNIIGILFGGFIFTVVLNIGADLQIVITLFSNYLIMLVVTRVLKLYFNRGNEVTTTT